MLITKYDAHSRWSVIQHLDENHAGIHPYDTNIFEHGLLRLLGYHSIPEECLTTQNAFQQLDLNLVSLYGTREDNPVLIRFSAPYDVPVDVFISDIQKICTQAISIQDPHYNFYEHVYPIVCEKITSDTDSVNGRYCLALAIPRELMWKHGETVSQHIDSILGDPIKKKFYLYANEYYRLNNCAVPTIQHIDSLVANSCLKNYPYHFLDDLWAAIVKKAANRSTKSPLKVIDRHVAVDMADYPNITFICETDNGQEEIKLTRDTIMSIMQDPCHLKEFLVTDLTHQEFLQPTDIHQFLQQHYEREVHLSNTGEYEIDLGHRKEVLPRLQILGIQELSQHGSLGHNWSWHEQFFVYDKKNYLQALIALKEIAGSPCFEERVHQLSYYAWHGQWDRLKEKLNFFLNVTITDQTNIKIDYTELGVRFFNQAKDVLTGEAQKNTLQIIFEAFNALVNNEASGNDPIYKKIHAALFEITMMFLTQQGNDKDDPVTAELKEKLLEHAIKADLEESNFILAELSGLPCSERLATKVTEDRVGVIIELTRTCKKLTEENAKLRHTPLSEKPTVQDKPPSTSCGSSPNFFAGSIELSRNSEEHTKETQWKYCTFSR